MENQDLQKLVEEISAEVFKKPFLHEAVHNPRLRTTGGRYMLRDHSIQINPLVLKMHGMAELIGVIKHELCHYHLHLAGKGYKHRDKDFKELLAKTSSPRYCKPLAESNKRRTAIHVYACKLCNLQYKRKRRMDVNKYRCGKCAGEIMKVR